MLYTSTRNSDLRVTAAEAIAQGIAPDGGLYVPVAVPLFTADEIETLLRTDYCGRAELIFGKYLLGEEDAWTLQEIHDSISAAYGENFADRKIAPVRDLGGGLYVLELFHGPTCAFKDMALQILPQLLTRSAKKVLDGKLITILTATSGDTGKAALEGFKDVAGTNICVFYPENGVSPMQKLQMTTQAGDNVRVVGVRGNFDDAQTGVKHIFADKALKAQLEESNTVFSSANSINWGRLLPQIVYYVSAYCDVVAQGGIIYGEPLDFCVPTGNFGNILAGYFAKKMGLPVGKLICASNANNVLTDFFDSGVYDRRREFFTTISPSMDILVSSNLERLLYLVTDDAEQTAVWMKALSKEGKYTIPSGMRHALRNTFRAYACNDEQTKETINDTWENYTYLADPHTAVGLNAIWEKKRPICVVSTASPYKFAAPVLEAITGDVPEGGDFSAVEKLAELTGVPCPPQLLSLKGKAPRFTDVCDKEEMASYCLF
ncbi:MAG: threonine synthase [Oscillospiraceae bacterium]|jgi:threonine synthase|nr:threonine synthase [Oscillospiraceae bacterium]